MAQQVQIVQQTKVIITDLSDFYSSVKLGSMDIKPVFVH